MSSILTFSERCMLNNEFENWCDERAVSPAPALMLIWLYSKDMLNVEKCAEFLAEAQKEVDQVHQRILADFNKKGEQ